ncbi:Protocadherin-1 [Paragonimus heterotremus]|uniref:Protocadherin-1 n=1 Tax=Paragonimus heterotremus TaxID=100268 RepID=A0A8J4SRZ4_9TREM|nr:Protocadherin-1 [Paragonimus heterotremus]
MSSPTPQILQVSSSRQTKFECSASFSHVAVKMVVNGQGIRLDVRLHSVNSTSRHSTSKVPTCVNCLTPPPRTGFQTFSRSQPEDFYLRYDIRLRDNTPKGTLISENVLPGLHGTHLIYSLLQTKGSHYFSLNNRTGQLTVARLIDRDLLCSESDLCCSVVTDLRVPVHSREACPGQPYGSQIGHVCVFNISVSTVSAAGQQPDIHELSVMVCEENDHAPVFKLPVVDSQQSSSWMQLETSDRFHSQVPLLVVNVSESAPVGHRIPLPIAEDVDAPPFHVQLYKLEHVGRTNSDGLETGPFNLEPTWDREHASRTGSSVFSAEEPRGSINSLSLVLTEPLDREMVTQYNYRILAVDGGPHPRTGTLQLQVHILDTNDNPPKFTRAVYETTVDEGVVGKEILQLRATDADEGANSIIRFDWPISSPIVSDTDPNGKRISPITELRAKDDLSSAPPSYWFRLNHATGSIYIQHALDYEIKRQHRFQVIAYNPTTSHTGPPEPAGVGNHAMTATATVIVNVRNLDDEAPHIVIDYATGGRNNFKEIPENGPASYFVAFVTVSDPDSIDESADQWAGGHIVASHGQSVDTSVVTCHLDSHQEAYQLERDSIIRPPSAAASVRYSLSTRGPLDREYSAEDRIRIVCQDSGSPPKTSTAYVTVKVVDENDCTPELQVLAVSAVQGHRPLLVEPWSTQKLRQLIEQQESAPTPLVVAYMTSVPVYTVQVTENQPKGTVFASIRATDKDHGQNGYVTFELLKEPPLVQVSNSSRNEHSTLYPLHYGKLELPSSVEALDYFQIDETKGDISTRRIIDREEGFSILDKLYVVVKATDHGTTIRRSAFVLLQVLIIDENDNPPRFLNPRMHFQVQENLPAPSLVGEVQIIDSDIHPDFPEIPNPTSVNLMGYSHKPSSSQLQVRIDPRNGRRDLPFILYRALDGRFFLNTTRALDRESEEAFQFEIVAVDNGHSTVLHPQNDREAARRIRHTATASVLVTVLDVNDNQPEIIFPNPTTSNSTVHRISYRENADYHIISINANDRDASDTNGKFYFELVPSPKTSDLFAIDRNTGLLRTRRRMTKEDLGEYRLHVIVRDEGTPPLETHLILRISVDQSEPHRPTDPRTPTEYMSARLSNLNPNDVSDYDRQYVVGSFEREMSIHQGLKRALHADILLIIIVLMIVILIVVMLGLCLYLRHKRGLFNFLPDMYGLCVSKNTGPNSSDRSLGKTVLGHPPYFKNHLDASNKRMTTLHDPHVYTGLVDGLMSTENRQHMKLDSLGRSRATSPHSPFAMQATQHPHLRQMPPVQLHSSMTLNHPNRNYAVDETMGVNDPCRGLPFSPTMIGSEGLFSPLPMTTTYRSGTVTAVNLPDVADQAETLHKQYTGYCRSGQPSNLVGMHTQAASHTTKEPFNAYNLGGFGPAYPINRMLPLERCQEFDFHPIPDNHHLYQRIYPDEPYQHERDSATLRRVSRAPPGLKPTVSHDATYAANKNWPDMENSELRCSLLPWRSDPSLNQGADGPDMYLFDSAKEQKNLKEFTNRSTKSLRRSNSNRHANRADEESKHLMSHPYSTLHEPAGTQISPVHASSKSGRHPTELEFPTDVEKSSRAGENYAVSFPKVQASFV